MKEKKKLSPLWLVPAVVVIILVLWCIHFPLTMFMGLDKDAEIEVATLAVYPASGGGEIAFNTNDRQQLDEIMEKLQTVRCRFFGWSNRMYYDSGKNPQYDLYLAGHEGDVPFNMGIWTNAKNDVIVQYGNTLLRAKDTALYDYLTALVEKGEKETARTQEETTIKELAASYVEKLSRVIYLYEDIELRDSTVLTYGDSPEMQYVVEKSEELKAQRENEFLRNNYEATYTVEDLKIEKDTATVTLYEGISFRYEDTDFDSAMGNEYTVTLKKLNGEWLVFSVEGGDTYSLKEMETYHYRKAMPELYEQASVKAFSFQDTLSVQVSNVIKTEKRILPAEDNFEYEVYTVLPGAEIEVMRAAVEDTVELGPLGIWKVYSKDGDKQYIEPNMPNIPITENTNGIGSESVCVLVFELYTGEDTEE